MKPTISTLLPENNVDKHPTYRRYSDSEKVKNSNKGEAELMWNKIYNTLPKYQTSEELNAKKTQFKAIYLKVKDLFNKSSRSDGTPYFYHLLETAFIVSEESGIKNLDIETIFVALLHDYIEDTHNNYTTLWPNLSNKGKEIAFGVHLISKPHFHTHIEDEEESINYKICIDKIDPDNIDLSGNIINESIVEEKIVKIYNELKSKYKPVRNKKHFENYKDFDTFIEHAKREAEHLGIGYTDEWLRKVCTRSIQVKLADRLHNLRTLGHMSDAKIIKKVKETEDYLLTIANKVNPIMAEKIRTEIKKLKRIIVNNTLDPNRQSIEDILLSHTHKTRVGLKDSTADILRYSA